MVRRAFHKNCTSKIKFRIIICYFKENELALQDDPPQPPPLGWNLGENTKYLWRISRITFQNVIFISLYQCTWWSEIRDGARCADSTWFSRQKHTEAENFRGNEVRSLRLGWRRWRLYNHNRRNKIVVTHWRGMFLCGCYMFWEWGRERNGGGGHSRPRESNRLQICAPSIFFIVKKKCFQALPDVGVRFLSLLNPCLGVWCVRLSWNVNARYIPGKKKILGKYL